MKLHAHTPLGHAITAHGPGYVAVDGHRHSRSLLLLPGSIDPDWGPDRFEDLAAHHLAALADLGDTVVLLGTGSRQRFPAPPLLRPLLEAGISLEVMDTAAACRTYSILMAEGRKVAAALIIE
jgi:uncharacterized protein